jgi:hypothetical protein
VLDHAFEIVEGALAGGVKQPALRRQFDTVLFSDEDPKAEIEFQIPDLVADRALADAARRYVPTKGSPE